MHRPDGMQSHIIVERRETVLKTGPGYVKKGRCFPQRAYIVQMLEFQQQGTTYRTCTMHKECYIINEVN